MKLRMVVISALMIATMSVGMTQFISDGLSEYGTSSQVNQENFQKLQKLENATSITTKAQDRAENVESKSNFFNLPGVVKTAKLTFDSIGLWEQFLGIIAEILGLDAAPGNWPVLLATGTLGVSVSFIFVKRFF